MPIDKSKWDLESGPKNKVTGETYPVASVLDPVTRRKESVFLPIGETEMSEVTTDTPTEKKRQLRYAQFFANDRNGLFYS